MSNGGKVFVTESLAFHALDDVHHLVAGIRGAVVVSPRKLGEVPP